MLKDRSPEHLCHPVPTGPPAGWVKTQNGVWLSGVRRRRPIASAFFRSLLVYFPVQK